MIVSVLLYRRNNTHLKEQKLNSISKLNFFSDEKEGVRKTNDDKRDFIALQTLCHFTQEMRLN